MGIGSAHLDICLNPIHGIFTILTVKGCVVKAGSSAWVWGGAGSDDDQVDDDDDDDDDDGNDNVENDDDDDLRSQCRFVSGPGP